MPTLDEFLSGLNDEDQNYLEELRLGPEPAMVIPFTADIEVVNLHYEEDESARGYIACPGRNCPACHLGNKPTTTALLPVYSIEHQQVRVLRIPQRHAPRGLGTQIRPLIEKADREDQMLLIRRDGAKYTVEARPLGENADRGDAVIEAYRARAAEGVSLAAAFVSMTAEEYAEVPRVKLKLDARGDYAPAK